MTPERLREICDRYAGLRVAVVGDFCLDRYLEIDPALTETSIETGRPVHNVVRVRAQPGGAGTIVNNLAALGVGRIIVVGFCGDDGEGYELRRALGAVPAVALDHFLTADDRRTFTYCKPLVIEPDGPPVELDRLDSKNWTPTSTALEGRLGEAVSDAARQADALILLEQVDREATGVLTPRIRDLAGRLAAGRPAMPVLADSRRGLAGWPPFNFKMNAAELSRSLGTAGDPSIDDVRVAAVALARRAGRSVFVTLAERGIVGADATGATVHRSALPTRGPIDIVGAGDSVTANLTAALAAGATTGEAVSAALMAASTVIHQLGTTGAATPADLAALLPALPPED